jgi:hypothetical protein
MGTDGPQLAAKVTLSNRGQRAQNVAALLRFRKDEQSKPASDAETAGPKNREREEGAKERLRRVRRVAQERVESAREHVDRAKERRIGDFAEGYVRLYHSQHPELSEAEAREEVRRLLSAQSRRNDGAARALPRSSVGERGETLEARG